MHIGIVVLLSSCLFSLVFTITVLAFTSYDVKPKSRKMFSKKSKTP